MGAFSFSGTRPIIRDSDLRKRRIFKQLSEISLFRFNINTYLRVDGDENPKMQVGKGT